MINLKEEGVLCDRRIRELLESGAIKTPLTKEEIDKNKRVQTASLDLTLGGEAWRIGRETSRIPVKARIQGSEKIDLSKPQRFEVGVAYLVRLQEQLELPHGMRGFANPKSTSGRDGLLVTLLTDNGQESMRLNHVPKGYNGDIWLEIMPQVFPVIVEEGVSLNHIRFFYGETGITKTGLRVIHSSSGLLFDRDGRKIPDEQIEIDKLGTNNDGLVMHLDLKYGTGDTNITGYKSKKRVDKPIRFYAGITPKDEDKLDPDVFWEEIRGPLEEIVLEPGHLYILSTIERIRALASMCMTLAVRDYSMGQFNSHFAGFFDVGWGCEYEKNEDSGLFVPEYTLNEERSRGTTATLEVMVGSHAIRIRHGDPVSKANYDIMSEAPQEPYKLVKQGKMRVQNYGDQQGVKLSKHFKAVEYVASS